MNQKPEDVDQGAWDAAKRAFTECRDGQAIWSDGSGPLAIARAIMVAEASKLQDCLNFIDAFRQTALSVAETAKDGGFDRERDDAFLIAYTAGDLATAIRKRAGGAKS